MDSPRARPYLCRLCGKRVHSMSALQQHTRIHRSTFPYQCSLCSKSFRLLTQLKRHQQQHDWEKPFACAWCTEEFLEHYQLGQHLLRKHKIMASSMPGSKLFIATNNKSPGMGEYSEKQKVNGEMSQSVEYVENHHLNDRKPAVFWVDDDGECSPTGDSNPAQQVETNHVTDELDSEKMDTDNSKSSSRQSSCSKDPGQTDGKQLKPVKRKLPMESTCSADENHSENDKDMNSMHDLDTDLNGNAMANDSDVEHQINGLPEVPDGEEEDMVPGDYIIPISSEVDRREHTPDVEGDPMETGGDLQTAQATQDEEDDTNEAIMLLSGLQDTNEWESVNDHKRSPVNYENSMDGSADAITINDYSMEQEQRLEGEENNSIDKSDPPPVLTGNESLEESEIHLSMMTDDHDDDSQVISMTDPTQHRVRNTTPYVLRGDPSLHVCPSREDLLIFEESVSFTEDSTDLEKSKPNSELSAMVPAWSNSCANLSGLITGTPHKLSVDPGAASVNASPAMSPFRATIGQDDSDESEDSDSDGIDGETPALKGSGTEHVPGPATVDQESSISPGRTETSNDLPIQPNTITFTKSEDASMYSKLKDLAKDEVELNSSTNSKSVASAADGEVSTAVPNGLPTEWKLVRGKFCKVPIVVQNLKSSEEKPQKDTLVNDVAKPSPDALADLVPDKKKRRKISKSDKEINVNKHKETNKHQDTDAKPDDGKEFAKAFEDFVFGAKASSSKSNKDKSSNNESSLRKKKTVIKPEVPLEEPESTITIQNVEPEKKERKSRGRPRRESNAEGKKDNHTNNEILPETEKLDSRPKREKRKRSRHFDHDFVYSDGATTTPNASDYETVEPQSGQNSDSSATRFNLRPNRRKEFKSMAGFPSNDSGETMYKCGCCTNGHDHAVKHKHVDLEQFKSSSAQVRDLQTLMRRLIRTVFPDLICPNLHRTGGVAVEYLMDEIREACSEDVTSRKALTPFGKVGDEVRIIVCKNPQDCLSHLRRKAYRLLSSLLPDIQSELSELSEINVLIEKVIETNETIAAVDQACGLSS